MRYALLRGDSELILPTLPENTFDAMVTDPPAGIGFMGRQWDSGKGGMEPWVNWLARVMTGALRTLKPGAHAFVWALPRTSHWTGTALEMAGFEVRDRVHHIFGSGMQHAKNASKAIDEHLLGSEMGKLLRPVVDTYRVGGNALTSTKEKGGTYSVNAPNAPSGDIERTTGATPEARDFDGYYTAVAPGCEDWWLVRKPLSELTLAANLLRWGTGALNVDACRVPRNWDERGEAWKKSGKTRKPKAAPPGQGMILDPGGSVPKNIVFSHSWNCEQIGTREQARNVHNHDGAMRLDIAGVSADNRATRGVEIVPVMRCAPDCPVAQIDGQGATGKGYNAGGVSRFFNVFYATKTSRRERDHGCDALPPHTGGEATGREEGSVGISRPQAGAGRTGGARNHHPTVKPGTLLDFLTLLVGRPGGLVIDPYAGSGSHGVSAVRCGMDWLGIELGGENGEYWPIIEARLSRAVEDYEANR